MLVVYWYVYYCSVVLYVPQKIPSQIKMVYKVIKNFWFFLFIDESYFSNVPLHTRNHILNTFCCSFSFFRYFNASSSLYLVNKTDLLLIFSKCVFAAGDFLFSDDLAILVDNAQQNQIYWRGESSSKLQLIQKNFLLFNDKITYLDVRSINQMYFNIYVKPNIKFRYEVDLVCHSFIMQMPRL